MKNGPFGTYEQFFRGHPWKDKAACVFVMRKSILFFNGGRMLYNFLIKYAHIEEVGFWGERIRVD